VKVADAVALAGHEVHVCRYREARTLLRWLGEDQDGDLRGLRVLDVAGGDGYWAGQARKRGARAVALDLATSKLHYGRGLAHAPALIKGDALQLPFADASFDRVMSICAIEHFDDGEKALDEMTRVLAPGGDLVMLAEPLPRALRALPRQADLLPPGADQPARRARARRARVPVPVQEPAGAADVSRPVGLRR